jgi:adenine deaminase
MEIMVRAGLTPLQVLRTATTNGAKVMGMERELGRIAPGQLADLVVLDADPLADVNNASRVNRVLKDGWIVRLARPPEAVSLPRQDRLDLVHDELHPLAQRVVGARVARSTPARFTSSYG